MELQFNSRNFHGASAFVRIKEQFELWSFHCIYFLINEKENMSEKVGTHIRLKVRQDADVICLFDYKFFSDDWLIKEQKRKKRKEK